MGTFWGLLTSAGIGASDLFGRRVVAGSHPVTAAGPMQAIGTLMALLATFLFESQFAWGDVGLGALSGLGLAAGLVWYYTGLEASSSTIVSPLVAGISAVIPFAYAIARGGTLSSLGIVGAFVAIAGMIVVTVGATEGSNVRAGIKWGVMSGLGYAFGLAVIIDASDASGSWPAVSQRLVAFLAIVGVAVFSGLRRLPPRAQGTNVLFAGLFLGTTTITFLIGLEADAPSAVVAASMFPLASVAVGWLWYEDEVSRPQLIGIPVALLGIALIAVG